MDETDISLQLRTLSGLTDEAQVSSDPDPKLDSVDIQRSK